MACKIIWSPASRDDLRDIVRFIARDNPQRAESFAYELMRRTDILQQHPEAGRTVPEYRSPQLRRSFTGRIGSSIASILTGSSSRSREYGTQHAGLRWPEPHIFRDCEVPRTIPRKQKYPTRFVWVL